MAVKKTETKSKKAASAEPAKKARAAAKSTAAETKKKAPSSDDPAAYNNDSIVLLKGADRVRKRPSVIFGSDNIEGCKHCFFEILANAIDEANAGYGSRSPLCVPIRGWQMLFPPHCLCFRWKREELLQKNLRRRPFGLPPPERNI